MGTTDHIDATDDLAGALTALAPTLASGASAIGGLRRLTGGASLETWTFDAVGPDVARALILRRRGGGTADVFETSLPLDIEAALIDLALSAGVPVAGVVRCCTAQDGIGEAYIMTRVAGETLGRRIAAGDAFAPARAQLGGQCARALAAIHAIPRDRLPALPTMDAAATLAEYEAIWRKAELCRPAIEAAFRWLADTAPAPVAPRLVHGDFRTGNLMVDSDSGLVAVLDWELAHLGDPAEDFGWLCVNSWRFGSVASDAGGFDTLDAVLADYVAAGGDAPPHARIRWWQAMGSLKWAVITNMMYRAAAHAADLSPERLVIGRRLSECEADLIALMEAA